MCSCIRVFFLSLSVHHPFSRVPPTQACTSRPLLVPSRSPPIVTVRHLAKGGGQRTALEGVLLLQERFAEYVHVDHSADVGHLRHTWPINAQIFLSTTYMIHRHILGVAVDLVSADRSALPLRRHFYSVWCCRRQRLRANFQPKCTK